MAMNAVEALKFAKTIGAKVRPILPEKIKEKCDTRPSKVERPWRQWNCH